MHRLTYSCFIFASCISHSRTHQFYGVTVAMLANVNLSLRNVVTKMKHDKNMQSSNTTLSVAVTNEEGETETAPSSLVDDRPVADRPGSASVTGLPISTPNPDKDETFTNYNAMNAWGCLFSLTICLSTEGFQLMKLFNSDREMPLE